MHLHRIPTSRAVLAGLVAAAAAVFSAEPGDAADALRARLRARFAETDKLAVVADFMGGADYPSAALRAARARLDADAGGLAEIDASLAAVETDALAALSAATVWRLGTQYVDALAAPRGALIAVNARSGERTAGVVVPLTDAEAAGPVEVRDAFERPVPAQRVVDADGRPAVAFVVYKAPPHGYRTYRVGRAVSPTTAAKDPTPDAPTRADPTLENDDLRAVVDVKSGALRSLVAKATGTALVVETAAAGDVAASRPDTEPVVVRVVERGPVRTVVRVSPRADRGAAAASSRAAAPESAPTGPTLDYVLWKAVPRLDVVVRGALPQDGGAPLPAFGTARAAAATAAPAGAAPAWSRAGGLAVLCDGVVAARGEDGVVRLRLPSAGEVRGSFVGTCALMAAADDAAAETEARALPTPLRTARVRPDERGRERAPELNGHKDEIGRGTWLTCEDAAADVESFSRADDGAWLVRVRDRANSRRDVVVSFPFDVVAASVERADGGPSVPLEVRDARVATLPLAAGAATLLRILPRL
jgi:hypothetical protein